MRNRSAVRGEVAAIEAPDPTGRRWAVASDRADLPLAAAEPGWTVTSAGRALSGRGRLLHRLLLGVADPASVVLHRNGLLLDCRRRNLITATRSRVAPAIAPLPATGVRGTGGPAASPVAEEVEDEAAERGRGARWPRASRGRTDTNPTGDPRCCGEAPCGRATRE